MTTYGSKITLNGDELLILREALKRDRERFEATLERYTADLRRKMLEPYNRVAHLFPANAPCPYEATLPDLALGHVFFALRRHLAHCASNAGTDPGAAALAVATIEEIQSQIFCNMTMTSTYSGLWPSGRPSGEPDT